MDKKQIIVNYVATHIAPDASVCPKFTLFWQTQEGTKIYDPEVGFVKNASHDLSELAELSWGRHWGSVNPDEWPNGEERYKKKAVARYAYFRYVKNIDQLGLMEVSVVRMKLNRFDRTTNRDKRSWEFTPYTGYCIPKPEGNRTFVFKDDPLTIYNELGNEIWANAKGKFYNINFAKWLNSSYLDSTNHNVFEFRKWAFDDIYAKNCDHLWQAAEAYKKLSPRKVNPKTEDKHQRLLSLKLVDTSNFDTEYPYTIIQKFDKNGSSYNNYQTVTHLCNPIYGEQTSDGGFMIRFFERDKFSGGGLMATQSKPETKRLVTTTPLKECKYKIYIDSTGKPTVVGYNYNTNQYEWNWRDISSKFWRAVPNHPNSSDFYIANFDEWKKFTPIQKALEYTNADSRSNYWKGDLYYLEDVIANLRNSLCIDLAAKGASNLARQLGNYNMNASAKEIFGKDKMKANDIDLTDEQLRTLDKYFVSNNGGYGHLYHDCENYYKLIKVCNPKDEHFENYLKTFDRMSRSSYRWYMDVAENTEKDLLIKGGTALGSINHWTLLKDYKFLEYPPKHNAAIKIAALNCIDKPIKFIAKYLSLFAYSRRNNIYIPMDELISIKDETTCDNVIAKYQDALKKAGYSI